MSFLWETQWRFLTNEGALVCLFCSDLGSPVPWSRRRGLGHCPHRAPSLGLCPGLLSGLLILSSWVMEGGLAAAQKEDLPHPMVSRRAISSPSKIAPGITIFVYYAQFGGVFRLEEPTLRSRILTCVDS